MEKEDLPVFDEGRKEVRICSEGGRLLICGKFVGKGRQLPDRAVLWYNVAYTEQGFRREAGSSWQVDAWED